MKNSLFKTPKNNSFEDDDSEFSKHRHFLLYKSSYLENVPREQRTRSIKNKFKQSHLSSQSVEHKSRRRKKSSSRLSIVKRPEMSPFQKKFEFYYKPYG